MAPPSRHGSPRRGSSWSPKKRKRNGGSAATKPTSPSKRSATVSPRTRTITPSSKASAEKALKVAAAVQVNIQFGVVEKYKPGIKILLPESIYGSAKDVSSIFFYIFVLFFSCFYSQFVVSFVTFRYQREYGVIFLNTS